ncbi:hypothetical protein CcaverHIS002_0409520 [Cutaneotrichosporon cavernicola]|uniref:Zn(2)-C6 fungal-type domain-containing protein n=1 Tax=Cutaneotrichosporon cavernicola TaxID=279322 RepID=A0AA48L524_9TREE|nr:uncharacterized protein CcaverHIS019_0409440 [Cutaneotrichosporon cavernicola]BEI84348.1 hypothetical protein CcaverHIS002_0409520 [Cutaneotrichosporon cavernicola]BEI92124.1 hypothetical protein CcaverHIS019_0409440 [Cutaneotrichosporon cavernicola]BEI99894.1 hypothetical protein CcaverHIS631_0409370 [Cutaneotrichosporon cavernicola]BEJ07669.1 hypothetical protein CcaverHIS641_0409380 [Cutaneotrichosporon cavernicola]
MTDHRPHGPPGSGATNGMPARTYYDSGNGNGNARGDGEPPRKKIKDELPSVLVREKKQKACANCRRAKLKCIVNDDFTECVRCLSRKERCVFYPRGHDEDYQQTIANDISAIAVQTQHLTRAMYHIMHHMMAQNAMPALDPPLPMYEAPERETSLQGWSAERNRELGKKRKSSSPRDDSFSQFAGAGPNFMRPADMHVGMGMTESNHQQSGAIQNGPLPQGPAALQQNGAMSVLGGLVSFDNQRTPNDPSISPIDTASFGPTSQGSVPPQVLGTSSLAGGAFGLLSAPRPSVSPEASMASLPVDHDQFGASDPRPNIVKRGVISNDDATILVDFFHSKLVRWLFGYRLEFDKFPYIPNGPCVMTPFILSVLCFISSERIPAMHGLQHTLGNEVNQLLLNSPADSFLSTLDSPFSSNAAHLNAIGVGSGSRDDGDGEDELDPELGIGPEEIVGACMLAMFTVDRDIASAIAASAFSWARGWIKWNSLTIPLPPTLGEVCGLLPIKRDATQEDMARIWLLCYIVDGTEALQRDSAILIRRDPSPYCHLLLPDTVLHGKQRRPNDVLLAFHARLISLLREWYCRRANVDATVDGMVKLANSTNANLDWWRTELDSYKLDGMWMRHINLFWEFARMLVNRTTAKSIGNKPEAIPSWTIGTQAAVGFLEKCSQWPQPDELSFIPPAYLNMMSLAGTVVFESIKEQQRQGDMSAVRPAEVMPLLNTVADMLEKGGVPDTHPARHHARQLRECAATRSSQ